MPYYKKILIKFFINKFFLEMKIKKASIINLIINAYQFVGVRRFELPTTRPPDAYSNRAELHPELRVQR